MTMLSKTLKAIALILGLLLSLGSTLIALDAKAFADSNREMIESQEQGYTDSYLSINLTLRIRNNGYFFDLYDLNITLLVIQFEDHTEHIHARDSKVISELPKGSSKLIKLQLRIPKDIAIQWANEEIELYVKIYFFGWFGYYGYKLLGFGASGISNMRGG